jgi:hypothetical protein
MVLPEEEAGKISEKKCCHKAHNATSLLLVQLVLY